jgi:hypothetical protein
MPFTRRDCCRSPAWADAVHRPRLMAGRGRRRSLWAPPQVRAPEPIAGPPDGGASGGPSGETLQSKRLNPPRRYTAETKSFRNYSVTHGDQCLSARRTSNGPPMGLPTGQMRFWVGKSKPECPLGTENLPSRRFPGPTLTPPIPRFLSGLPSALRFIQTPPLGARSCVDAAPPAGMKSEILKFTDLTVYSGATGCS